MATNEEIKVVIKAEDKATKEIDSVSKSLGGFGLDVKKLVAGLGLIAGAWKVFDFGRDSVMAFIEAEKQMVVANSALNNSLQEMSDVELKKLHQGMSAGMEDFEILEKAMSDAGKSAIKLAFDDEAASVAFAKLFQATKSVEQANKDLALAMDLASFKGVDLETATLAVAKAHAGSTRELMAMGIQLKDNATSAEILAKLQETVGGTAEAMSQTTGKQLEILGIQWDNLKESVGGALAEAIRPFIEELVAWASQPETQQKIQEIVTAIGEFATKVIEFVQKYWPAFKYALQVMGEMIRIVWVSLSTLWGWLQAVMHMIDSMVASIMKAVNWLDSLIQKLRDLAKELAKGVLNQVGNFGATLTKPIDAFLSPLTGKKQLGGEVASNQPYLVGEGGPEVFVPNQGGRILSSSRVGGITINITGNTLLDEDSGRRIGDQIIHLLKMNMRV